MIDVGHQQTVEHSRLESQFQEGGRGMWRDV